MAGKRGEDQLSKVGRTAKSNVISRFMCCVPLENVKLCHAALHAGTAPPS